MEQLWEQLGQVQPRAAIPTRMRRVRRVSVNIEADGGRRCRCPKAPNYLEDLFNPWAMHKYQKVQQLVDPAAFVYALQCDCPQLRYPTAPIQEAPFEYMVDRLEYQQQPQAESQTQLESQPVDPTNQASNCSSSSDNSQSNEFGSQLSILTDLVRQTILKLDSYMAAQGQQQAQDPSSCMDRTYFELAQCMDPSVEMGLLNKLKQGKQRGKGVRKVKVVPVQPLVFMSPPAAAPAAAPAEPAPAPVLPSKLKTIKHRPRPRKKRSSIATPESSKQAETASVLESSSTVAPLVCPCQNTRDNGTTMWCPMECCKNCCGVVTKGQSIPFQPSGSAPLPVQLFTMEGNPLYTCNPAEMPSRPQKADRVSAGKLSYSYIAEEQEQEQDPESEAEQTSSDDWYQTASVSLAHLEQQENYFAKHKVPHTDFCSTDDNSDSPTHFVATADKAVCTRDMCKELATVRKPTKILRIYKRSAMKSRRVKKAARKQSKVKFVKLRTEQPQLENETSSQASEPRSSAGSECSRLSFTEEREPRFQTLLNQIDTENDLDRKLNAEFKCNPLASNYRTRSHSSLSSTGYPSNWSQ